MGFRAVPVFENRVFTFRADKVADAQAETALM